MGRVDVRIPDSEEELLNQIRDAENYQSRSELVREAIRDIINRKIEREEMKEVKKRIESDSELIRHEKVMEEAGLE